MMALALAGRPLQYAIAAAAGCGFLLFGYDQGVMSGLLTGDAFTAQFPEIDTTSKGHGSSSLQGTVVAIYEIGCFSGAMLCFFTGERLGRRWCMMVGAVILSIGAALQASAYGIPQMIVGRVVAGLGNGYITATVPVWHSELSKAHNRGRQLGIELAVNIFGVMLSYWIDYGMSFVKSGAQFRVPLALQIVFGIIVLLSAMVLPESPRWLIRHGRHEQARRVIWSIQPEAHSMSEADNIILAEMELIQRAVEEEQAVAKESSLKACFANGEKKYLYRTMLGIGGQFMQQISGINLITYYATVIFEQSVGLSHDISLLLAGFNGIAYFLSALPPIWTIDKLGRRKLMLFSAVGQCCCMAVLAGTVWDGSKASGIVAAIMLFLFNFFFANGLLAVPWLVPAEYAPLEIRTQAASLATASNWVFTYLVVETVPVSIGNIGWGTYAYFSVFNALFVPLIYFFYPETRLLSLEQIDHLFINGKVKLHWDPSMGAVGEAEVEQKARAKEDEPKHLEVV